MFFGKLPRGLCLIQLIDGWMAGMLTEDSILRDSQHFPGFFLLCHHFKLSDLINVNRTLTEQESQMGSSMRRKGKPFL